MDRDALNRDIQRIGSRVKSTIIVEEKVTPKPGEGAPHVKHTPKKLPRLGRALSWFKTKVLRSHTYTSRGKGIAPVVSEVEQKAKLLQEVKARAPELAKVQQLYRAVSLARRPSPLDFMRETPASVDPLRAVSMPGPAPSAPPKSDA